MLALLVVLRGYSNSFNLYNVADLSWNRIGRNGVQTETENGKFSRSPQNLRKGRKMKNSPSCAHVLQKTLNLVISRSCCFADDGKEMYKNIKRTCRATERLFLLIKPIALWHSRCRRRRRC